jgi:hypothetical protein
MPRALLKNGVICPIEPLPADWHEGTELTIEKYQPATNGSAISTTDQWMDEVEALAAKGSLAEDKKLTEAVAPIRHEARELARKGKR